MKINNPAKTVIVFDLDDTLYAEYEYKLSGIKEVVNTVSALYPEFESETLLQHIHPEGNGWLDELCQYCKFNDSEKQTLLWLYRLHQPSLIPYYSRELLAKLLQNFAASALITDGRSLTQRLKLKSLGFTELFDAILVSEAYCSEKPDAARFKEIEQKYSHIGEQFIYIGDNIKKDFVTPNQMGWITIGLRARDHNIHKNNPADFPQEYQPDYWIQSLEELETLI